MINNIKDKTVAELVAEDYRTADVFKRNGIDFCCGGKVSVKEICDRKDIPYDQIKSELIECSTDTTPVQNFNEWDIDFLADYIINVHHKYVNENVPMIAQYAKKVATVHGNGSPETVEINRLFGLIAQELMQHMHKEEMILFPYIKNLAAVKKGEANFTPPAFGSVRNPIQMMEAEHDDAGDIGKQIMELTNNYAPPQHACNTFRVLYAKLREFEEDLHQHIHLENNILFPKAILLEEKFMA